MDAYTLKELRELLGRTVALQRRIGSAKGPVAEHLRNQLQASQGHLANAVNELQEEVAHKSQAG